VLPHSRNLREGLAETLALIGNRANSLTHCTQGKALDQTTRQRVKMRH
jgi:hypothetical protein